MSSVVACDVGVAWCTDVLQFDLRQYVCHGAAGNTAAARWPRTLTLFTRMLLATRYAEVQLVVARWYHARGSVPDSICADVAVAAHQLAAMATGK